MGLYVHVSIYLYVSIMHIFMYYTCAYVYMCKCIYVSTYVYAYLYIDVCILCVCMHVDMCECVYVIICVFVYMQVECVQDIKARGQPSVSFLRCHPLRVLRHSLSLDRSLLPQSGWLMSLMNPSAPGCSSALRWQCMMNALRFAFIMSPHMCRLFLSTPSVSDVGSLCDESVHASEPSSSSSVQMEQCWQVPDSASWGVLLRIPAWISDALCH